MQGDSYHIYTPIEKHGLQWTLSDIWYGPTKDNPIGGEETHITEDKRHYHAYLAAYPTADTIAYIDRDGKDYRWGIEAADDSETKYAEGYAPTLDAAQAAVAEAAKLLP